MRETGYAHSAGVFTEFRIPLLYFTGDEFVKGTGQTFQLFLLFFGHHRVRVIVNLVFSNPLQPNTLVRIQSMFLGPFILQLILP